MDYNMKHLDYLISNLRDADCPEELINQFVECKEERDIEEALRLLAIHRRCLLDCIHTAQQKLDCLDYLIYQLKQEKSR